MQLNLSLRVVNDCLLSSGVLSRLADVPRGLFESARHVFEAVVHRNVRLPHAVSAGGPVFFRLVFGVANNVGAVLHLLLAVSLLHLLLLGCLGASVGLHFVLLLLSLEIGE